MVKVVIDKRCGNTLKMELVKQFCIYLAKRDINSAVAMLSDDVHIWIPGSREAHGVEAVRALLLEDALRASVIQLKIDSLVSRGNCCAVAGMSRFSDGRSVAFCSIYTFGRSRHKALIVDATTYYALLNGDGV